MYNLQLTPGSDGGRRIRGRAVDVEGGGEEGAEEAPGRGRGDVVRLGILLEASLDASHDPVAFVLVRLGQKLNFEVVTYKSIRNTGSQFNSQKITSKPATKI